MTSEQLKVLKSSLKYQFNTYELDSKTIQNSDLVFNENLTFHAIRPILNQFLNASDSPKSQLSEQLNQYIQKQVFLNLQYAHEIRRLLTLFKQHAIKVLPYKGVLFVHELYGNKQLREVGDIDFLFHPDSAAAAMRLLLDEGYEFKALDTSFDHLSPDDFIERLLAAKGQYEVPFQKGNLHIDCHWGLHYGYLPYKIDFQRFFDTAVEADFYGVRCQIPSTETLFWMLILHHGGKEFWTRMKHFADLQAFLTSKGHELNWAEILKMAKAYQLYNIVCMGFYLLNTDFAVPIPPELQNAIAQQQTLFEKNGKNIRAYWHFAQPWAKLNGRLRFEQLLYQNQDEDFSWWAYFNKFYITYTLPNPVEHKRIVSFPDTYPTLNFISKVVTYFLRKFR